MSRHLYGQCEYVVLDGVFCHPKMRLQIKNFSIVMPQKANYKHPSVTLRKGQKHLFIVN